MEEGFVEGIGGEEDGEGLEGFGGDGDEGLWWWSVVVFRGWSVVVQGGRAGRRWGVVDALLLLGRFFLD